MSSLLKKLSISIKIHVVKQLWSLFDQFPNCRLNPSAVVMSYSCELCSHRRCRRYKTVSSRRRRRCALGIKHHLNRQSSLLNRKSIQYCTSDQTKAQYTPPTPTRRNCRVSSRRRCVYEFATTPCPEKKGTNSILGITSSNIDRFSKFFQCCNLLEISNKTVIKFLTNLKLVATLPCKN